MSSVPKPPKALVFDLMGTCTNWHSSILLSLQGQPSTPLVPAEDLSSLAAQWRAGFFAEIHRKFEAQEAAEDIDVTHRRVLDRLLQERGVGLDVWGEDVRKKLVASWHSQSAWPDAISGIERLKRHFFVIVLANGTTRLQLDLVKSSGLPFHALFSSQVLGLTKPDPKIYLKALGLLDSKPDECMMVAAHAYDLRAASQVGMRTACMRTAYIHRSTEDPGEDMQQLSQEFGLFVDGTTGGAEGGLHALADVCLWSEI